MKLSKIKNRKSNKKVILIIFTAILVIGIGGTVSAYYLLNQDDTSTSTSDKNLIEEYNRNDVDLSPSSNEQQQAGSDIKKGALDSENNSQPSGPLSLTLTALNQTDSTVQIRTQINSVANGSCELSLIKGATVITRTSEIQPLATNSTCQGFDIPLTELDKGTWTIKVKVTNDNASGEASRTIDII